MKFDTLAVILCSLGALLVVIAIVLQNLIVPQLPVRSAWSREDAEALQEASMRFHQQSFDPKVSKEELAETDAEYRAHEARLEAARSGRVNLPKYFQYSGFVCIAAGAVSYVVGKAKSES